MQATAPGANRIKQTLWTSSEAETSGAADASKPEESAAAEPATTAAAEEPKAE